jgi:hypothetical protein
VLLKVTQLLAYRTLTISAGTGGTIVSPEPPGANYVINAVADISAAADTCYEFDAWTGDTDTIADVNDPTTTIVMDDNYAITATFVPSADTYSLTLTADPVGSGYPSFEGSSPFTCGANVPIYANPEPGCTFINWAGDGVGGVADPNAADTTVQMTDTRNLVALFNGSVATPTPEPLQNYLSTIYLTQHITADNFSLTQSGDLIVADMNAGVFTSMGKYVNKSVTLDLRMRPAYLLPEESFWGVDAVSIIGGLRISGGYNSISGNVKVNGTVTVVSTADFNDIDGTLTCPDTDPDTIDPDKLSWTRLISQASNNVMPDMGDPQDLFKANLSVGTTDWDEADVIHQYVFTDDVDFTDVGSDAYVHCWLDLGTHELKPGLYYSPGTITLETTWDGPTSGTVTFIADQIIINNNYEWGLLTPKIQLGSYWEELLFWANGSAGDPATAGNGDILIQGESDWHACVSLEGVLFAPNGEIELAGSGRTGWFGYTDPAELYEGALIGQSLTISGSHWNFYRW